MSGDTCFFGAVEVGARFCCCAPPLEQLEMREVCPQASATSRTSQNSTCLDLECLEDTDLPRSS